jgi:hypothetical protein
MADLLFLSLVIGFFALLLAFIKLCEKLMEG